MLISAFSQTNILKGKKNPIFFLPFPSFRDRSGDCCLHCNGRRAADISTGTAHPHQEEESRGLVGGRAAGTPALSNLDK